MLSALKKGNRVVTIGGIHGTIQSVKEQSVILKVDDNTKIEFNRSAISSVITVTKDDDEEENEDEESESSEKKNEKK
jgi:preprotein translocase subunit YajC